MIAENLDRKVGNLLEVEELTGRSLLGATPMIERTLREPTGGAGNIIGYPG